MVGCVQESNGALAPLKLINVAAAPAVPEPRVCQLTTFNDRLHEARSLYSCLLLPPWWFTAPLLDPQCPLSHALDVDVSLDEPHAVEADCVVLHPISNVCLQRVARDTQVLAAVSAEPWHPARAGCRARRRGDGGPGVAAGAGRQGAAGHRLTQQAAEVRIQPATPAPASHAHSPAVQRHPHPMSIPLSLRVMLPREICRMSGDAQEANRPPPNP